MRYVFIVALTAALTACGTKSKPENNAQASTAAVEVKMAAEPPAAPSGLDVLLSSVATQESLYLKGIHEPQQLVANGGAFINLASLGRRKDCPSAAPNIFEDGGNPFFSEDEQKAQREATKQQALAFLQRIYPNNPEAVALNRQMVFEAAPVSCDCLRLFGSVEELLRFAATGSFSVSSPECVTAAKWAAAGMVRIEIYASLYGDGARQALGLLGPIAAEKADKSLKETLTPNFVEIVSEATGPDVRTMVKALETRIAAETRFEQKQIQTELLSRWRLLIADPSDSVSREKAALAVIALVSANLQEFYRAKMIALAP